MLTYPLSFSVPTVGVEPIEVSGVGAGVTTTVDRRQSGSSRRWLRRGRLGAYIDIVTVLVAIDQL